MQLLFIHVDDSLFFSFFSLISDENFIVAFLKLSELFLLQEKQLFGFSDTFSFKTAFLLYLISFFLDFIQLLLILFLEYAILLVYTEILLDLLLN